MSESPEMRTKADVGQATLNFAPPLLDRRARRHNLDLAPLPSFSAGKN